MPHGGAEHLELRSIRPQHTQPPDQCLSQPSGHVPVRPGPLIIQGRESCTSQSCEQVGPSPREPPRDLARKTRRQFPCSQDLLNALDPFGNLDLLRICPNTLFRELYVQTQNRQLATPSNFGVCYSILAHQDAHQAHESFCCMLREPRPSQRAHM